MNFEFKKPFRYVPFSAEQARMAYDEKHAKYKAIQGYLDQIKQAAPDTNGIEFKHVGDYEADLLKKCLQDLGYTVYYNKVFMEMVVTW